MDNNFDPGDTISVAYPDQELDPQTTTIEGSFVL